MIILFLLPLTFAIIFSIHTCFLSHPLREKGFPDSSDGKESICNAGERGSIPGLGRSPGRSKCQPTPVSLPGKSHGQRSLVGCSPWDHKELDKTE